MTQLFILGSGFSKAVSDQMPTVGQLRAAIDAALPDLPGDKATYRKLASDTEELLTYLLQAMPWKTPEESLLDRAAFIALSRSLAEYIASCETRAFKQQPPDWARQFTEYLQKRLLTVATLNYDTVLERLSTGFRAPRIDRARDGGDDTDLHHVQVDDIYQMPLTPLRHRTTPGGLVFGNPPVQAYRLLKLHGSTNWYYSGEERGPAQQVYFDDVPASESALSLRYRLDLVPLIIPPVAEKTQFYGTQLVRTLWTSLRSALAAATDIYCVGYSIPKTDLTMRLFLSAAVQGGKTLYIVNSARGRGAKELSAGYRSTFAGCHFDDRYLGRPDAVQAMVADLVQRGDGTQGQG